MTYSTILKDRANSILSRFNLKIETLTACKNEKTRLSNLLKSGYFEQPVVETTKSFSNTINGEIVKEVSKYKARFDSFARSKDNDVGYTFNNDYFSSPDAEILYSIIRLYKPDKIIKVGSGYSTNLIRQAIVDGNLRTKLICVDPNPRTDIDDFADSIYNIPVEMINYE